MADKIFLSKSVITELSKHLFKGLKLQNAPGDEKKRYVKLLTKYMGHIYSKIDKNQINDRNLPEYLKNYKKMVLQHTMGAIKNSQKKSNTPKYPEKPKYDLGSTLGREQYSMGDRPVQYMERPQQSITGMGDGNMSHAPFGDPGSTNDPYSQVISSQMAPDRAGYINSQHERGPIYPPQQQQQYQQQQSYDPRLAHDMTEEQKLEVLMQQRGTEVPMTGMRPPTPDFSLDGSGKKKKQQQYQQQGQQYQQQGPGQSQYQQQPTHYQEAGGKFPGGNMQSFQQNQMTQMGSNELGGNSNVGGLDGMFQPISNPNIRVDESVSTEARLKQLQAERGNMDANLGQPAQQQQQQYQPQYQQPQQQLPPTAPAEIASQSQQPQMSNEQFNQMWNQNQGQQPQQPNQYQQNQQQQQPQMSNEQFNQMWNQNQGQQPQQQQPQQQQPQYQQNQQSIDQMQQLQQLQMQAQLQNGTQQSSGNSFNLQDMQNQSQNQMDVASIHQNYQNQIGQLNEYVSELQNMVQMLQQQTASQSQQPDSQELYMLRSELDLYKQNAEQMRSKLEEYQKSGYDPGKMGIMEEKQHELMQLLTQYKEYINRNEAEMKSIQSQKAEVQSLIDKNKDLLSSRNVSLIVDSRRMDDKIDEYRYNLEKPLKNVKSLDLISYDLPNHIFNINSYCNCFYFSLEDAPEETTDSQKIITDDTDNSNSIQMESPESENEKDPGKITRIKIRSGSYDIVSLIKKLNKTAMTYGIVFSSNSNTNRVTIKCENKSIRIYQKEFSINKKLGFMKSEYSGKKLLTGESPYDLREERYLHLYIKNLKPDQPFAELMLGSKKQSFRLDFEKEIPELEYLDIQFTTFNKEPFNFNRQHHILEFDVKVIENTYQIFDLEENRVIEVNKGQLQQQSQLQQQALPESQVQQVLPKSQLQQLPQVNQEPMPQPTLQPQINDIPTYPIPLREGYIQNQGYVNHIDSGYNTDEEELNQQPIVNPEQQQPQQQMQQMQFQYGINQNMGHTVMRVN